MSDAPNPSAGDAFSQRLAQSLNKVQGKETTGGQPAEDAAQSTPSSAQAATGEPVGQGEYLVRQGDCIASIAKNHGHFWETIWSDGANAELREARKDPNVLLPDDRVTIPEKQRKDEPIEPEMRHRFTRRGEPAQLRIRLLGLDGKPRANEPYTLEVDGRQHDGTTDAEGQLRARIAPHAQHGKLTVGQGEHATEYTLNLGELDPLEAISGVQGRLLELGFDCHVTGEVDEDTTDAIAAFQQSCEMDPTGELDEATRKRIQREYERAAGA
jgi:N-acetylmuramoyl-L-alanine amidase